MLLLVFPLLASCRREASEASGDTIYTCSMHPSVRTRDPKAKCPICGMDLVPVKKSNQQTPSTGHQHGSATNVPTGAGMTNEAAEFMVPVARQQQIGVTYAIVERKPLSKILRVVGTVTYNKQRHWDYVSRVEGYVQKLHVASRGEQVEQNQALLTLYSPELLTTQREFLDLLRMRDQAQQSGSSYAAESSERLLESAKVRLRLWNIGEDQIAALEKNRKPQETLTLYSPFKGVVQDLAVDQGRRVMPGDHLLDIADLSVVWVWAEFYQEELPLIRKQLPGVITTSAFPGEQFKGRIELIDPFTDEAKRTTRVRIDVDNPDFKLRPDMYVDAEIHLDLGESLAIPETAVMPTGKRSIVFVDKGEGRLDARFVQLGRKAGDVYEVLNGLSGGERVVNSANFLIDAEAKIQGALKGWESEQPEKR